MKRLFLAFTLVLAFAASAEYQVFRYTANLKHIENTATGARVVTAKLNGYAVIVCCYPCGAHFGKAYQNWLYVKAGTGAKELMWRIPVRADGGIFGKSVKASWIEDNWYDWEKKSFQKEAKKADKSWCQLYYRAKLPGLLGGGCGEVELYHSGFGAASTKENKKIAQWFNPYLKNISGTVTGTAGYKKSSFDPASYDPYGVAPVTGEFSLQYDSRMTEAIRGHAEWDEIDKIIYRYIKFGDVRREEPNSELWE